MKLTPATSFRLLIATLGCGLASCSLPPEAAWRVIHTDGLVPLIAMEMGTKPYPPGILSGGAPASTTAVHPVGANTYMSTPADRVQPVVQEETPKAVVHTERERPPVPQLRAYGPQFDSDTPSPSPRPNLITKKRGSGSPVEAEETEPEHKPAVIATARPRQEAEPVAESRKDVAEVPTTGAPQSMSTGAQAPAKKEEGILPYGIPVPNRPGLVNSPYAGKRQFVDVAGLKPGQEVKCPYSGKLFLVPPGAQAGAATTKPLEGTAKPEDNRQ